MMNYNYGVKTNLHEQIRWIKNYYYKLFKNSKDLKTIAGPKLFFVL
jgi:hypothetical protein